MSELRDFIDEYNRGGMSDKSLVLGLANWNYCDQDKNSSSGAADANYVEGTFDEVLFACDVDIIADDIYEKILKSFEERTQL